MMLRENNFNTFEKILRTHCFFNVSDCLRDHRQHFSITTDQHHTNTAIESILKQEDVMAKII